MYIFKQMTNILSQPRRIRHLDAHWRFNSGNSLLHIDEQGHAVEFIPCQTPLGCLPTVRDHLESETVVCKEKMLYLSFVIIMIKNYVFSEMHFSWIPWNLSFRYIHHNGQFTPKMKANAKPRLLSSLVWIDSGIAVSQHRVESFLHEMKCNGVTSFMEFVIGSSAPAACSLIKTLSSDFLFFTGLSRVAQISRRVAAVGWLGSNCYRNQS